MNTFIHSGCMGDAIAALPIMRQLGGGHLVMTQRYNKRILRGKRYEMLKPLLECQPYIQSVSWDENPTGTHDFTNFRKAYKSSRSLTASQASWLGIDRVDMSPWLHVKADPRASGRVAIARTERYQRQGFPWAWILRKFQRDELFFVGTKEEHESIQSRSSYKFEWIETSDMLEVASLIAGSKLFIGNQSSPCWIAMALGHPLIQETHEWIQDSIIERPNAQFYGHGNIDLSPYCLSQ